MKHTLRSAKMYLHMNGNMYPILEFTEDQQQPMTSQSEVLMCDPMISAFFNQDLCPWMPAPVPPQQPLQQPLQPPFQPLQQPRSSLSTRSSSSSDPRLSISTDYSFVHRSSMTSTNSSMSNMSDQAYNQRRPSFASACSSMGEESPMPSSYAASPAGETDSPVSPKSKRKPRQRQASSERDRFATCVSRTKRSRRSQREPRYWCTSCEEPFIEKYDWKRHEQTYQERRFAFRCGLCRAIYFLEKDFLYHHETRHHCETCYRDGHLEAAKHERQARTGWGCGFCTHFSNNWREWCNHVAQHFERDGKTMNDWHQTDVIMSLLQRPAIRTEWIKILQSQPQLRDGVGWNKRSTARVEGYPENGKAPHLQDQLEYFRLGDNAAALAQLAFAKIAFPAQPPQAPQKDNVDNRPTTQQPIMYDQISWGPFTTTIPDDSILPEPVQGFDFGFRFDFGFDTTEYVYDDTGFVL